METAVIIHFQALYMMHVRPGVLFMLNGAFFLDESIVVLDEFLEVRILRDRFDVFKGENECIKSFFDVAAKVCVKKEKKFT